MGAASGPGRDSPATLGEALSEFARHPSPRILMGIVVAAAVLRAALGGWSPWDLAVAAVLVALWPVQEWLIHVFILHWRPRRIAGRTLDFTTPRMHRAHHRDPWQLELVFVPTHVLAYAPLGVGALLWWLAPAAPQAATALLVYFTLALHYEWVHFLVHTRYRPRTRRYRRLWRNHRLHHFKNEHYWYGVTMLGGDRLLGTRADPAAVPTSPTCRTLGLEESLDAAR